VARKIFPLWQQGRYWSGKKWKGKGARSWKEIMLELGLPGNEKYYQRALSQFVDRLYREIIISRMEANDNKQHYWDKNSEK
jgi:hypothetical protein